jgi:D-sedoheptulose 7-phosphate isomerase
MPRDLKMHTESDRNLGERIRAILRENIEVATKFSEGPLDAIVLVVNSIREAFSKGHKVLLFGNGGSAADAQHIAAEFVNRFMKPRAPLPALALTTDTSILTSVANDEGFEEVFAKQIRALAVPGDVVWGISTSGNSSNVIRGLRTAKEMKLSTVGMTGGTGGEMRELVDHWINVNHSRVPRIQEIHIIIGHIVCELVEDLLFPEVSEVAG